MVAHFAQHGRTAAVGAMLDAGADISARGWMDATPLHWACCFAYLDLLDLLLERGAPALDVGGFFQTPSYTATHHRWKGDGDYEAVVERLKSW